MSDERDKGKESRLATEPSTTISSPVANRTGETTLLARTLGAEVEQVGSLDDVAKRDLCPGDWVLVRTKNSIYTIRVLGGDNYSVSGGWFDREGLSPQEVSINGCTWGGSAIKCDIVAAPGLFLEFSNTVKTTRIQEVCVIRSADQAIPN